MTSLMSMDGTGMPEFALKKILMSEMLGKMTKMVEVFKKSPHYAKLIEELNGQQAQ